MSNLPQPDAPAYDGSLVVKTTTFGKSSKGKTTGINKVQQIIAILDKEVEKRLTIDRLDPDSKNSLEVQVLVNKEVVAELRKVSLILTTFMKNN